MSWPKKHTRRVHFDDQEYLWHLNDNTIETETRITVGAQDGKFFLFIDPYAHDLEITPSSIRRAIQWALGKGWTPGKGPTRGMAYSSEKIDFFWLPDDVTFAYQMKKP